jgi:uncharacterized membrane protein YfcA
VKEMKLDRMGVLVLMSHLIITLAIIGIYGYTLFTGHGDETLKTALMLILGYWFGAMGANTIKKKDDTKKDGEE